MWTCDHGAILAHTFGHSRQVFKQPLRIFQLWTFSQIRITQVDMLEQESKGGGGKPPPYQSPGRSPRMGWGRDRGKLRRKRNRGRQPVRCSSRWNG